MINLNSLSKKLLLLQRNELLSRRQKFLRKRFGRFIFTNFLINFFQKENIEYVSSKLFQDEIDTIKNFLPKKAYNIMDIGCGLGIINIFLNEIYQNEACFYLLDKNHIDTKIKYGFSLEYESYNDLSETKKILLENGINENRINLFDVDRVINIEKKIDLVISLKSMGYHYPFENYIKLFKNCCNKDTIFIFDIASNQYEIDFFKKYFDEIKIIYSEESIHSLKRLCCNELKL
jgi:SAM-dependent methyltransferase